MSSEPGREGTQQDCPHPMGLSCAPALSLCLPSLNGASFPRVGTQMCSILCLFLQLVRGVGRAGLHPPAEGRRQPLRGGQPGQLSSALSLLGWSTGQKAAITMHPCPAWLQGQSRVLREGVSVCTWGEAIKSGPADHSVVCKRGQVGFGCLSTAGAAGTFLSLLGKPRLLFARCSELSLPCSLPGAPFPSTELPNPTTRT